MDIKEEIMLDGKIIELPQKITEEEKDDTLLLDSDMPTEDLSGVLENTKEIDWNKDE